MRGNNKVDAMIFLKRFLSTGVELVAVKFLSTKSIIIVRNTKKIPPKYLFEYKYEGEADVTFYPWHLETREFNVDKVVTRGILEDGSVEIQVSSWRQ